MNTIKLIGTIDTDVTFSHNYTGEDIYTFILKVIRTSGNEDLLPCMVSGLLISNLELKQGDRVEINGSVRTKNKDGHLNVFVWVDSLQMALPFAEDENRVEFTDCAICKTPVYRVTPSGKAITDLVLASNRLFNKSDYIPTICWGRYANSASNLEVADRISGVGRLQSRIYIKKYEDGSVQERAAYEMSVVKYSMSEVNNDEER